MATIGPGLMKLPSLGSSPLHKQVPISADDIPPDHRRASITDPSLHAHSAPNGAPLPASNFQSAHGSLSARSTTLPSLRELAQPSTLSCPEPEPSSRMLQLPSQPVPDPGPPRRGSAADLDHILINSHSPDHRYHHQHQQHQHQHPMSSSGAPFPRAAHPNQPSAKPQHSQLPQLSQVNPSTGAPSSPPHHLHMHTSHSPVSPRSFPSILPTNYPEINPASTGPLTGRQPSSAMRRRGSRVNEPDGSSTEDPSKFRAPGPGANPSGPDHPRGFSIPGGSQWPYPTPHHRHHLHQKPPSLMKRRHSSQNTSDSIAHPPVYYGLAPDQNGPADHPWHPPALLPNHSQRETLGEYTLAAGGNRLDMRRQSQTSTVSSSTGTWFDRRPSGESGVCEGADDSQNLMTGHALRHRSWSSSSNPPFSPNQTVVAASIGNYEFPPLQPGEKNDNRTLYPTGHGVVTEHDGWNLVKPNPFENPLAARRGSGVEDELKDRLAGTRLLDRHPHHSHPAPQESAPLASQPDMDLIDQSNNRLAPGGTLSPYSRSPELKISHKLAERKRRKEMRDLFDELREVLPVTDERHSKGSKWETLSRAVDYMQQIRHENERLKAENLHLQSKLNSTSGGGSRANGAEPDPNPPHYPNHGGFG
ncbi:hypothetical protein PCANC_27510 [Puccinia coronata f. sp. avenae]|uniref:BHLH domain-containing protein n=1 Tax=Puccinia coronata f. sp. avenae TaxID=200324 RepID=A0A2N5RVB8_9BASI|nr:hypothetical protein PCANC_27510 [Puccinia coronata f. sp. avenae]